MNVTEFGYNGNRARTLPEQDLFNLAIGDPVSGQLGKESTKEDLQREEALIANLIQLYQDQFLGVRPWAHKYIVGVSVMLGISQRELTSWYKENEKRLNREDYKFLQKNPVDFVEKRIQLA